MADTPLAVTLNDLRLAERTLLPGGVAALDDVLNADWTGVLSGLADYHAAGGTLVPAALIPNKLLLATDAGAAARTRALLRRRFPLALSKQDLEFMGAAIDNYAEHPYYAREAQAGLRRQCADLSEANAALQAQLAARPPALDPRRDEIARLEARIAQSEDEVARMRASTSWRLTGPLRRVATLAKR